jgi:hypothetical protein
MATTGIRAMSMIIKREPDWEELRDAEDERRARFNGCKCGNPDWPGRCPGWRNCPVHGDEQ